MHKQKHKVNWFGKSRENALVWAFTLVELIVVVTILAILSTIGFVSYSSYLIWVRDTNRISNLKSVFDGMVMYRTKYSLPMPDDKIEIKSNWILFSRQWYAWANTLESIEFSSTWKDPKDDTYYSYYLTRDRKYVQLMWFLEDASNSPVTPILASSEERYPIVYGDKLGILTWTWTDINVPIQAISSIQTAKELDIATTTTPYNAHMADNEIASGTWTVLSGLVEIASTWWYFCGADSDSLYCLDVPMLSSLVGFWDFESSYNDRSDTKNTGTANDGASISNILANSDRNNYAIFDWINNYIEIPDHANYQIKNWTVSLWAKMNNTTLEQGLFSRDAQSINDNGHFTMWQNNWQYKTRIQELSTDDSYTIYSSSYTQGNWDHIVTTFGSDGYKMYINWVLDMSNIYINDVETSAATYTWWIDWNYNPIAIWASAHHTWDGNLNDDWDGGMDAFADALIDNIMIYNVALSASEVLELYNKQK